MYDSQTNPLLVFFCASDPRNSLLVTHTGYNLYHIYVLSVEITVMVMKKKMEVLKLQVTKDMGRGMRDIYC